MNVVLCDECGTVDETGDHERAAVFADEHRRRQPEPDEHEVWVLEVDGPAYEDFKEKVLEKMDKLVDAGGSPSDVMREKFNEDDITKVAVKRGDDE